MSAVGAYDVIVIGAGGAGMAAAVAAADHGARVLLLEADAHVGGSTALSGGVFYAADTDVQRAAGVHGDSAARLYEHFVTYNRGCCEPRLVRVLAERGPDTLEWLESLGVAFKPEDLYVSDIGSVARGHTPTGGGQAISDAG